MSNEGYLKRHDELTDDEKAQVRSTNLVAHAINKLLDTLGVPTDIGINALGELLVGSLLTEELHHKYHGVEWNGGNFIDKIKEMLEAVRSSTSNSKVMEKEHQKGGAYYGEVERVEHLN